MRCICICISSAKINLNAYTHFTNLTESRLQCLPSNSHIQYLHNAISSSLLKVANASRISLCYQEYWKYRLEFESFPNTPVIHFSLALFRNVDGLL